MALTIVATYDISEDARRARVSALLSTWGDRVQYSVFLCVVEPEELPNLVEAVSRVIEPATDSFLVFRQCATCTEGSHSIGQAITPSWHPYWSVW